MGKDLVAKVSTVFQIHCATCNKDGPKLRRGTSGVTLCLTTITGPFTAEYHEAAKDAWAAFLIEHEFHDLRLATGP
jgi:hypothetical protein